MVNCELVSGMTEPQSVPQFTNSSIHQPANSPIHEFTNSPIHQLPLSVIVLNHNGRVWLPACLDALAAQRDAPPFEVILVDNGSSDGSAAFVESAHPRVRVVRLDVNAGFAAGNNAGARAAAGAWLAFLNNDT